MRRFAVACLLLALAACGRDPMDRLAQGGTARVVEVRSGDTLEVEGGKIVRLVGIDAPNSGQPYAEEARAALGRLAAGKTIRLRYGGVRTDAYGRLLAQAQVKDGPWLQRALLEEGAAFVRTYDDNRALASEMLKYEEAGRQARRGVWALEPPLVRLPVEVIGQRGFRIVEGRVTAAAPDALVLDDVMRAEVVAQRREDFAALKLGGMRRRLVRVRGRLGRDGVLKLDHPEQVEVLESR